MNRILLMAALLTAMPSEAAIAQNAVPRLTAAERAAIFTAAGFKRRGNQWRACDDDGTASYTPGAIETVRDLNGDSRPEAVVTESTTYCYGNTETGYTLVSKQADGRWKMITNGTGIPEFLKTKGVGNWPDIEVGGPGFCFPVERWNGKQYILNRYQYDGKRCRPN